MEPNNIRQISIVSENLNMESMPILLILDDGFFDDEGGDFI
jgi:hypothetical protein